MLRAPVYAGRIGGKLTGGETVKAAFTPLVPEPLFDKVQLVLAGQGHVPSPHHRNNEAFALRGLIRCGKCGKLLTASFATGRHGKRYGYYSCWDKSCRAVYVRREGMERDFLRLLADIRIESEPLLQRFREHILNQWQVRNAEGVAAQGLLKDQAEALGRQQASLLDKMLRGVVDEVVYKVKNDELAKQIAKIRAQYQVAAGDEFDLETAIRLACLMVQNAARLWWESSVEHRQRLQGALFPDGLAYVPGEGLGTASCSWPVRVLKVSEAQDDKMGCVTGFEPATFRSTI
jgi:site-specific DNA recombinase